MKYPHIMAFLIISFVLPYVCYSNSIPSHEETISQCKEFLNNYQDSKDNFESSNKFKLFAQHTMCSQSAIYDKLDPQERSLLDSISIKAQEAKEKLISLKPEMAQLIEQLEKNASYFNKKWEHGYEERYTPQEINEFDIELKRIWSAMVKALSENKIEKALSYFHDRSRDNYRTIFTTIPPEIREKMADDLSVSTIALDKIRGDTAIYELLTSKEGKTYSHQLTFIRNLQGEWMIHSY